MIEVLPQSHDAVVAVRATGLLTDADYKQTLITTVGKDDRRARPCAPAG